MTAATGQDGVCMDKARAASGLANMPPFFRTAVMNYCRATNLAYGTRAEYRTTLKKWVEWGGGVTIEKLGRKEIRDFLDWVYERAVAEQGTNPGRTANKAREQLRAIVSWAWE